MTDEEIRNFLAVAITELRDAILRWSREYAGDPMCVSSVNLEPCGEAWRLALVLDTGERVFFPVQFSAKAHH